VIGLWLALANSPAYAEDPPPTRAELEEQLDQTRAELAELRARVEALDTPSVPETPDVAASPEAPEDPPPTPSIDPPTVSSIIDYTSNVTVEAGTPVADAISGQDVRVDGHVTGNATSFAGDVIVGDGGVIDGDATTFSGRVKVEPGGEIHGNRVAFSVDVPELGADLSPLARGPSFLDGFYRRLVLILSFAGAGVMTVGVFPKRIARVARGLEDRPVHSAFVGAFASGFVTLFSALLTVLTLGLGFPVALVLLGGLGVAWMLGFMGLCQAVGDHLPFEQKPHGRWVAFLVGVLLVTSIGSLPWLGWMVIGGSGLLGIGAALSTRFGAEI
jgi:hypothetical protein